MKKPLCTPRTGTLYVLLLLVALTISARAQSGEELFKQNCASCHSIGKGDVVGPDLKGLPDRRSEEWILKFVRNSQTVVQSGDADAVALFEKFKKVVMPPQNLNDDQIKSIVAHVKETGNAQGGGKQTDTVKALTEAQLNDPNLIRLGKAYFEGSKRFTAKGPSCISCHNIRGGNLMTGGTLAIDLTNSFTKLGGINGLTGMLGAPPFPAMNTAFENKAIQGDEINALVAFLNSVNLPPKNQVDAPDYLLLGGSLFFLTGICLVFILWYGRKIHSVKKTIYDRQIESIN